MHDNIFTEETLPKILTKEEIIEHFNKYKLGSLESRDILITHNIRLVIHQTFKNFSDVNVEKDELVSIGLIGLIKAVDTYEISKGEFSTYASKCINNEILQVLRKKQMNTMSFDETIHKDNDEDELKLMDIICDDSANYIEQYEEKEIIYALFEYINNLDIMKRQIIKMFFGIDYSKTYTQIEISEILGFSPSYISRIIKSNINQFKMKLFNNGFIELTKKELEELDETKESKSKESHKMSNKHKMTLLEKILNKQVQDLSLKELEVIFEWIQLFIESLENERNKNILKLYYGFYDNVEYDYNDIIKQFNITKNVIGKIIQRNTIEIVNYLKIAGIIDVCFKLNKELLHNTKKKILINK